MPAKTPITFLFILVSMILWNFPARSQARGQGMGGGSAPPPAARAQGGAPMRPGASAITPGASARMGRSPGPQGGVGINPLPFAPSFPGALGNTVGGYPPGTVFPGYGNINQPGLPPGSPTMIPNINNPAGIPYPPPFGQPGPGARPSHAFHDGHRHGQLGSGAVYYGVPYGVPYYAPYYLAPYDSSTYYGTQPAPDNSGATAAPALPPSYQIEPTPFYESPQSVQPPEPPSQFVPGPQTEQQQAPSAPAKTVTVLAFQDHTLIAVTDYWLSGDSIYYMRNTGEVAGFPITQLDLPLTEQLNHERNIPFVLESRP